MGKVVEFNNSINNYKKNILLILKDARYSEVCNYLNLLPKSFESDSTLYLWGKQDINEYYKKTARLERIKAEDNSHIIRELQEKLYTLYNIENYNTTHLSFSEFITFSTLLYTVFSLDNNNTFKEKKYKYSSSIYFFMNNTNVLDGKNIVYDPSFNIVRSKLNILLKVLYFLKEKTLNNDIKKCQFNDRNISLLLSKKRSKEVNRLLNI